MQAKNVQKRLVLNKETIANLSKKEMVVVRGGCYLTGYSSCYSCKDLKCEQP